ncbi:MAG: TldD/PmbA family protein [Erysipelotrichaceae bacterium]|nr:TldD/PmbA family protein [Erysipelotrichaceae bacterium]
MISKRIALEVLNAATATGADFAEIYVEEDNITSISVDNCEVESCNDTLTHGVGIRLLKEFKSVYGFTSDVSRKGLMKLAKSLAASFEGERILSVKKITKARDGKKNIARIPYYSYPREKIVEMLVEACRTMLDVDEKIVRSTVDFQFNDKKVEIFNSDGNQFNDVHSRGRAFLVAYAAKEGAIETFGNRPGAQKGMEFFLEEVDLNKLGREAAEVALKQLDARECPAGKMPVIIGNGFGGVIFHEACGHPLEASSVAKGLSIFSGKKGQKIASDIVNAFDDGTIDGGWGSGNVDDEGNKTKRTQLIKDGILNSYLIDNFNGRRMGEKGNGACRRESYKYEPTSRMSNTFIDNGKSSPESIIAATDFGLYAKSMGGGSVNPATGEFNFAVNEAYIVENGKLAYPVKGATLIGSGKDILLKVDMVGNDLKRAQGMCGASSGSIPADVGEPTIRVREMTVGGRGGAIKRA